MYFFPYSDPPTNGQALSLTTFCYGNVNVVLVVKRRAALNAAARREADGQVESRPAALRCKSQSIDSELP